MKEETITIPQEEYDQLKADQNLLYTLQAAGVDNWDGYELAVEASEE